MCIYLFLWWVCMVPGPVWRPLDEHVSARAYAEEAIVRAVYTWPTTHTEIFTKLTSDNFQNRELRDVFHAGHAIFHSGAYVDVISLANKLAEQMGKCPVWFPERFTTPLQMNLGAHLDGFSADNIQHVAHWIDLLLRHQRFQNFKDGAESARTIEHMLAVATAALENEGILAQSDEVPLEEALERFADTQSKIIEGSITAGASWGVDALDDLCLLVPGCFYVVAGIKKGGKSHLLQHTLIENAKKGNPTFFFSLEMGIQQVLRRWMAHETGINSRLILTKTVTKEQEQQLRDTGKFLAALPLKVNQSPRITPAEVLARVRSWKRKERVPDGKGVVAVDFLQLMPLPDKKGQSDASGIKDIAYELARLAKETQCAVIAAAQLRNEAEGQRPAMRYLEGSGGIAQAAEAILLLDLLARRAEGVTTAGDVAMDVTVYQRSGESGRKAELLADLATSQFKRKYGGSYYD